MKTYHYIMSHLFYHLGDIASKPMSWGWLDKETPIREFIGTWNYRLYNYLMLKSVDFNDAGGHDVWRPCEWDDDDDDDVEDAFTPLVFTKKDEK